MEEEANEIESKSSGIAAEGGELAMAGVAAAELLSLSPEGVVVLDAAGRVVWFNAVAGDFFGLTAAALGQKWGALLASRRAETAEGGGTDEREVYVRGEGERPARWLERRQRPYREGSALFYTDISEHKKMEKTLQREQELLRKLFEQLPVMITLYDPAVERLEGNRAFQEITGWSNEALATMDIMEAAYPDPEYREEVRRFMDSLQGWRDLEMTVRDGSIVQSRWANIRLSDERQVGIGLDIREQKAAEAALKTQARELALKNQQLQGLFDHAPAGLVLFDASPPYRILAHNRVYQEIWPEPYQSEGLVGVALSEFSRSAEEAGIVDIFRAVVESGEGQTLYNFPFDGLPQGRTWWNWHLSPIVAEGEVVALAHMAIEVTQEVEARAEAEAERARLEAVLAEMPAGVVIAEAPSGRLVRGNKQVAEILGHPYVAAESIAGYDAYRGFHADGRPLAPEEWPLARAIRAGEVVRDEEIVHERGDGSRGILNISATPIHDEQGEIVAGVVVFTDVSEQKAVAAERERLLQALAEERQQLSALNETLEERVAERTWELVQARDHFYTLFHASPIPKAITRLADGHFRNVNVAYERYFGEREADLVERSAQEVGLWPGGAEGGAWIERLWAEREVHNVERQVENAAGETRTVLISVTLFEMEGETYAITAFIDINERIEAEQQIRTLASELTLAEQRERRRIAQILHDDIQQMLVAHQLNLHMVGTRADEAVQEALGQADAFVGEIIEAIRSLSSDLITPPVRSEQLRDALSWLAAHMEERYQLRVDVDAGEGCSLHEPEIRELVVQMVRELLFNVVKHAGVGNARVRASAGGTWLTIEVEDDGQGFDSSTLEDPAVPRGFGLYSIGERLELFGGEFEVRSAGGEGTRVTLRIPKAVEGTAQT